MKSVKLEDKDKSFVETLLKTRGISDILIILPLLALFIIREFGSLGRIRPIDLSFIRYFLHPEYFVNDDMWFNGVSNPYTYFHKIIAYGVDLLNLENSMPQILAVIQFITILLLILALKKLCDHIFHSHLVTGLFIVLVMFIEWPSLVGRPPLEMHALTLARALLVFSLLCVLRGNFWCAGILARLSPFSSRHSVICMCWVR